MAPGKIQTLYEVSTRPYLYELSKTTGKNLKKLEDIPDSLLDDLKTLGINIVWFMGVWKVGEFGIEFDRTQDNLVNGYKTLLDDYVREDAIGSPYAIVEYVCNPELGTDEDILALKKRLNSRGMRLMLDFVPNHYSRDSALLSIDDKCFVHEVPGKWRDLARYDGAGIAYGCDMYCPGGWPDTLQLNYWNPKTIEYQKKFLMKVASLCDGIRCDMAMCVLNWVIEKTWGENLYSTGYKKPEKEFWGEAIAEVKAKYPDIVFMAECYWNTEETLHSLGFDYTYDKELLDRLESGHMDNIRGYLTWRGDGWLRKSAHFTENHDEKRAVAAFHGNRQRANAAAAFVMTVPGLHFFNHGQFQGFENKLDVHLRRSKEEPAHADVETFYAKLVKITSERVFFDGKWSYIDVRGDNCWRFVAYRWALDDVKRLIVANFTDYIGDAWVPVADAAARNGKDEIEVVELLTGSTFNRSADQMKNGGLHVVVDAYTVQIFSY